MLCLLVTPDANRYCVGVVSYKLTPGPIGRAGVPLSAAKKALQTLGAYDILAPNGLVVAQHFKRDDLPKVAGNLVIVKESRYGDTILSIYRKA